MNLCELPHLMVTLREKVRNMSDQMTIAQK
jgi:hypothetical protein